MPITEHQRRLRQKHLGSSDAPRVLNVSPWGGPVDVFFEKTLPLADDEPTKPMQTGNRLEPVLLDWAAEELGVALRRNQFRVASDGVLAANLDAMVVGKREALETKYVGPDAAEQWGTPGTDQVPVYVAAQVQHQMYVVDLDLMWVPVFIARFRPAWEMYRVPRDQEIIDAMIAVELAFWADHVLPNVPPDEHCLPPVELLRRLKREPGSVVELSGDAAEAVARYELASANTKTAETEKKTAYAAVVAKLGQAEAGQLPDGRSVTYMEQSRSEHFVKASTFRVLRIKSPKGA